MSICFSEGNYSMTTFIYHALTLERTKVSHGPHQLLFDGKAGNFLVATGKNGGEVHHHHFFVTQPRNVHQIEIFISLNCPMLLVLKARNNDPHGRGKSGKGRKIYVVVTRLAFCTDAVTVISASTLFNGNLPHVCRALCCRGF
jgi:hypothetical protein